jgi:protein ImuA
MSGAGTGAVEPEAGRSSVGASSDGPVVLSSEPSADRLYRSGLLAYGLPPQRLLVAEMKRADSLVWTMEQGARCRALAGVVAEVWRAPRALTFTASRRLMLAARQSGVMLLLLRLGEEEAHTAAWTRWQVVPAPSLPDLDPRGLGPPRFDVELTRNRTGGLGRWRLAWNADARVFLSLSEAIHEAHAPAPPVALAGAPRHRSSEKGAPGPARGRRRG